MIINLDGVYVYSSGVVSGPLEAEGLLAKEFDESILDNYDGCDSFELCEQSMVKKSIDYALRKGNLNINEIDVACGGDLLNQCATSNYVAKELPFPFLSMYAACATSCLVIGEAALLLKHKKLKYALAFTSSHYACAQRQYRFPNGYGLQKKECTTYTVTGAGALVLSNQVSNIKLKQWIIGQVIDIGFKDVNDMGSAMAPAVYHTLNNYLIKTKQKISDFDLIVSGDLSKTGLKILKSLLTKKGYQDLDRINDCGLMIYNDKQKVFCGGSGCACSMVVLISKLLKEIKGKRILLLASGALLTPILSNQKQSIPCICHGIVFEGGDL